MKQKNKGNTQASRMPQRHIAKGLLDQSQATSKVKGHIKQLSNSHLTLSKINNNLLSHTISKCTKTR